MTTLHRLARLTHLRPALLRDLRVDAEPHLLWEPLDDLGSDDGPCLPDDLTAPCARCARPRLGGEVLCPDCECP